MSNLSRHDLTGTAWTATWLSHLQSTRSPHHECPHATDRSLTAKSNMVMIGASQPLILEPLVLVACSATLLSLDPLPLHL